MGQRTRNKDKGGPISTPAPTTEQKPFIGRDFGAGSTGGSNRYGQNQAGHPSSAGVGKSITSEMADSLRSKQTGLDDVIANGSRSEGPDVFKSRGDPGVFKNRGGKK